MLHVLRLVNTERNADLESLVRTMFTSLQVVPLRSFGSSCSRHQYYLQHCVTLYNNIINNNNRFVTLLYDR